MPVEMISPELERIVDLDAQHEVLSDGHGPEESPEDDSRRLGIYPNPEGPVWWAEEGCLYFSDIGHNHRMRWSPADGVSIAHEPTNYANGLTRDPQGRLVGCEQGLRRVTRIEHDGSTTVIANRYRGIRLNRPNDVVCRSDGAIYFSDPGAPSPHCDLDFSGYYMVTPDLGEIVMLVDLKAPNGLAISPDESTLYLTQSRNRRIWAYNLMPNGSINRASERLLFELPESYPAGVFDGMKVDVEGNLYITMGGGIAITNSEGKHLGNIWIEEPPFRVILPWKDQISNCGWGMEDNKTLFYTGLCSMGRIQMKIPGLPVPPRKL